MRRQVVATLLAASVLGCSCSGGGSARPSGSAQHSGSARPSESVPAGAAQPPTAAAPPAVPSHEAYLGVWANPAGAVTDRSASALQQAATLGQAAGFQPGILGVYTPFSAPLPVALLQDIVDRGSVPLISWACASTTAVESGRFDAAISSFAEQLRRFGRPVFVRWFWEMNLNTASSDRCIGGGGPATFVSAWRRVWTLFHQAGATNAALVWCPGAGRDVPGAGAWFPGADYVDWIGADGYDRQHLGDAGFGSIFSSWYVEFQGYGKPMMIAETGATSIDQASYLAGMATALPVTFPLIRAVVYFDAAGPYGSWILSPDGVQALAALGRDPYFSQRG